MPSREEKHRQETALRLAVLDALTERVNRSTATPREDTGHLPDNAGFRCKRDARWNATEEDSRDIGPDDEDDDWRDIRACGDDPSLPLDPFVHFYDSETKTMYYVADDRLQGTGSGARTPAREVSPVDVPSTGGKIPTIEEMEVDKRISKLKLMDGQFGPRGYSKWLLKKIQDRYPTESKISGFATLCNMCLEILTHSVGLFAAQFDEESGRTGLRYKAHHGSEIFSHHGTLPALRASAHAGCHLCSLLLGPNIRDDDLSRCDESWRTSYILELFYPGYSVYMRACVIAGSSDHSIDLAWKEEPTSSVSSLKFTTTNAPEVRDLAQSWLSRCLRDDEGLCSVAARFLPSRLIEIDTENGTLHSARLVLGKELPSNTKYLTLSHCWGDVKAKPVSLTQQTLNGFRDDIPLRILSKTFRETLQVTTWLGYRHVWIDSLCILQDSEKDWMYEAARMGDIYRHSTCTIAATGARDGRDGLFFERKSLAFTECPLFRGSGRRLCANNWEKWPEPLSERAWAVQERCLPSRTLKFGSDMISWACRRTEACEGPHAHDIQMRDYSFPKLLDGDTDEGIADAAWKNVVREYSACKLTFWKDKWPAFQGLTAEVEKAQGWTIVHGLRTHVLVQDLLWKAILSETGRGTIECGEPSWSWLNLEDGVYWPYHNLVFDAEIVLQEPPAPIRGVNAAQNPSEHPLQVEACTIDFKTCSLEARFGDVACTLAVKNPEYDIGTSEESEHTKDRLLRGRWYPDTYSCPDGDLQALQIRSQWEGRKGSRNWNHEMDGLVITAVPDRPGYWRRVGMYTIRSWHNPPAKDSGLEDSDERSDSDESYAWETLSEDEAALRGFPCPWNREKTTIFLI